MNTSNVAVVFAGQNALDQSEIRLGVLRIPEVTQALRDSQAAIEKLGVTNIDLRAAMLVDDRDYSANSRLRSLLTAIVQVGLYERWNKTQPVAKVLKTSFGILLCSTASRSVPLWHSRCRLRS